MSRKIIKGDELQIWIGYNNSWLNPKWATAHSLTLTGSTVDIATKDHGYWGATSIGNLTWEITAECFYSDNDFDTLFDYMISKKVLDVVFAEVRNYSANGLVSVGGDVSTWEPAPKQRKGKCVISSLNANANTGENATFSITFTGSGPLKSVDYSVTDTYLDVTYYIQDIEVLNNYKIYNTINGNDGVMSIVAWGYNNTTTTYALENTGYIPISVVDDIYNGGDSLIVVRYYLANNKIPAYMFQNLNLFTFNGHFNDTVTVGKYAFYKSSVSTGPTITQAFDIIYEDYCFADCVGLETLNASPGQNLSQLDGIFYGEYAFRNTKLIQVNHFDTQKDVEIKEGAFQGNSHLHVFYMSQNTSRVGSNAFQGCPKTIAIHFYQYSAPDCTEDSYGDPGDQYFKIHFAQSVETFLGEGSMARYYPEEDCNYEVLN